MSEEKTQSADQPVGKKRIGRLIAAALAALALIAGIVWIAGMPRPYKYYLENPDDNEERQGLAKQVAEELTSWREDEQMSASADDPDRLFPLDRLPIVWAIQAHHLNLGRLPTNLRELAAAGMLADLRVIENYNLEVRGRRWQLRHIKSNRVIAVGN